MNTTDNQEEVLIVVDEDDTVLDYLPRSEVHAKKLLHRTISVIVYNSKGDLVLQRRSMGKDTYPGMLGNAVGGHVTKGQDYTEAAKQETTEELKRSLPLTLISKTILEDPNHRTMTSIYKTIADGPYEFNKEEIDEILTVAPDVLSTIIEQLSPPGVLILKAAKII